MHVCMHVYMYVCIYVCMYILVINITLYTHDINIVVDITKIFYLVRVQSYSKLSVVFVLVVKITTISFSDVPIVKKPSDQIQIR